MMKPFHLCMLFLSVFLLSAGGQPAYTFKHLGMKEGLSNDFILELAIDGQGFVWAATESGLNRWTGAGNTVYKESNSALASDELTSLHYDKESNTLWIGTLRKGISLFHCRTQQFGHLTTQDGLASNAITDIEPSTTGGGVWISHRGSEIQHLDIRTLQFTTYGPKNVKELGGSNRCCRDDGHGQLYVGHASTGMSVIHLKRRTAKNYRNEPGNPQSLPGDNVRAICIDRMNRVWVGTNNGLALFNPITETFIRFKHSDNPYSLAGDNIYCIREMDDGTLWIASDLGGVSILHPDDLRHTEPEDIRFQNITESNSALSSPNVRTLAQDASGNVWIGNYSTGMDFMGHSVMAFGTLPYYKEKNGEKTPKRVYGMTTDREGQLWLGSENELALCRDNQIIRQWDLSSRLSFPYSLVYTLTCDSKGILWLGIENEGVICYNPQTDTFKHIPLKADNLDIRAFYENTEGNMLIGSEDGIYACHEREVHKMDTLNRQMQGLSVTAIVQDRQRKLWVGTLGGGVSVFDTDHRKLTWLHNGHRLASDDICQIFLDSDGEIWIATHNGLAHIKDTARPEEVEIYDERQGITDSSIRAIVQDRNEDIWVSTYSGIARWDVERQRFYNYGYQDGVPIGSFMEKSAAVTGDGTLCFGSINGVCHFNPHLPARKETISPVHVIACETLERQGENGKARTLAADGEGSIDLPYTDNSFRISFTVADYAQSGRTDYAFMMEGLDKAWYSTEGENNVTFRNLDAGRYTFRIKARLRNGEWDEANAASVRFRIRPPWWASGYAVSVYVLAALLTVFLIFRSYRRKLLLETSLRQEKTSREMEQANRRKEQELNDERLRFYTNIVHELRTPLTLIIGPLEDLTGASDMPRPYIHKVKLIHRSALQLLQLINRLLEFRKAETQNRRLAVSKGRLDQLVTEIGLRYKELNRNERVTFRMEVDTLAEPLWFDADVVTTILNNLLSNAIKYTPSGEICLSLHTVREGRRDCVETAVSDTGYGIAPEALPHVFDRYYQAEGRHQASGTGIGLALVKALADLHEGILTVDSTPGQGTRFSFRLMADNTYPNALHKEGDTPAARGEEDREEETADGKPVLLVVEDNADIRGYIHGEMEADYTVLEAADGKEGLELALERVPNIIVSDIMMPAMDGTELCRTVKEDVRTSHIPVILLTAKDSIRDKEEGYTSGADSYLTKPFSAKLLRARIRNLLESRQRLAQLILQGSAAGTATDSLPGEKLPSDCLNPLDEKFLKKLNTLIEENLDMEKLDIAFMTDRMNMSHSTFYRKVKALCGVSPNEYIRKIKLKNSLRLLLGGGYNITEAACMTGFNNMGYFRECFKEEFGMSPSEYLRQKKG